MSWTTSCHLQKTGSDPIDQGLLNQAVSFYNGGSRCMAYICITPLVKNSPMAPAVVCFAFSVELYLKLLHAISMGAPPKGHKLAELFCTLPNEIQQAVTEAYGQSDLAARIAAVSDAFVEWRYQHEYEALSVNPQVLMDTAMACHVVVRRLRPELKVFGENEVAHF